MDGTAVSREELSSLLEAARWAPSGGNGQPWRFAWALRGTPAFAKLLDALAPFNQEWAHAAGALVLLSARTVREDGKAAPSAAFDAGAAWLSLALQASISGLAVHAMGGYDREKARAAAALPAGVEPQVVIAVGHPGDPAALSERVRARETPSDRLPVAEFAREIG
jgi:nitroreductase